jgi:4-amino-4-deoxy-L-arabinose transferase-like glycosyltransferase
MSRSVPQSPDRRTTLALFILFLFLYVGTAKGVLEHVDDLAMLRVTQSIVRDTSVAVPPDTPGAMAGVDGRFYTRYGLGQSLLAIPFYVLGSLLPADVPTANIFDPHGFVVANPIAFSVTALGILSAAGSVALVFLSCRALGFGPPESVLASLSLGLGTFAWFYARTFMSEPTSMFTALLAFYGLLRFSACFRVRADLSGSIKPLAWLALSGVGAGLAILLRIANVVLLPIFGLWLLWMLWRLRWYRLRLLLAAMTAWLLPIVVCGAIVAAYNALRFGTVFETGYAEQAVAFETPLYIGLYGLLLSSGKSLFVCAPITLAGVAGWLQLCRRRHSVISWVVGALVGTYVVFYARYDWWYGGGPWGPRFLTVILPFICLCIAALLGGPLRPLTWLALGTLALLSVGVQLLSILMPYLPYEAVMEQDPANYDRLLFNPAYSPLVVQARSLLRGVYPLDLAFTYYPVDWLAWLQIAALVAAVCLLLVTTSSVLPRRHSSPT